MKIKESEKRNKYLDFVRVRVLKKTMEHEGDGDAISNWCAQNNI